jgi:hypothetical protein
MRYLFFILLTTGLSVRLFGQRTITGKITNEEHSPLEYATVMLKAANDSSIVSFATTDDKGIYQLQTEKEGAFFLQASYVGYASQYKPLNLTALTKATIDFTLKEDAVGLQELIVKGRKTGVRFGQDTVRYDISHFKDGSEVVLGDVLNKLPGIVVDDKGGVKAHGKTVDKVLLNGQDFFQGDTQMATKNLSADMAENVEILNNYSEYSMLSGFQSHEQTVINVGVNKDKLGKVSGNLSGGVGVQDKFEFKGNLLQIKPKSMTSLIGSVNNDGEEVFNIEDYIKLQGGVSAFLDHYGGGNTISLSQEEQQLLTPKNNVYKRTNGISGINFACQPSHTFKTNAYLLYHQKEEDANERTRYTYPVPNADPFSFSKSQSIHGRHRLFSGYLKADYQSSPTLHFSYRGVISNMDTKNTDHATDYLPERTVPATGRTDAQSFKTRHNLSVLKSLDRHLLTATVSFALNKNPSGYALETDSLLLPFLLPATGSRFHGIQRTRQRQWSGSTNVSFLYKIDNTCFLRMGLGASATNRKYFSDIYQEASTPADYLNDFSLTMNDYNATISIVKNRGLFQFKLGTAIHLYDFDTYRLNHETDDRNAGRLTPHAEVSLHFSQKNVLSISATQTEEMNEAGAFIDKPVIYSYQNYTRNSRVRTMYQTRYQLNLNYRLFDLYSNTMLIVTGSYNNIRYPVSVNYQQDGLVTGKNPVSVSPTDHLMLRLYLNKGLAFIPWTAKLTIGYDALTSHHLLSETERKVRVGNTTGQIQFLSNYHRMMDFEARATVDINNSHFLTGSRKQMIRRYAGNLKFNFHRRIRANAEMEYVINRSTDLNQRLYVLNAGLHYALSKKVELNLSGMNLLHLSRQDWTSISYSDNYIAEKYFYQIPGHIMLKMKYVF